MIVYVLDETKMKNYYYYLYHHHPDSKLLTRCQQLIYVMYTQTTPGDVIFRAFFVIIKNILYLPVIVRPIFFNPFSAGPEISRGKKMSRYHGSRDISGQSVFFSSFVCKINVFRHPWRQPCFS